MALLLQLRESPTVRRSNALSSERSIFRSRCYRQKFAMAKYKPDGTFAVALENAFRPKNWPSKGLNEAFSPALHC
jgi:hypothetical protein